MARVSGSYESVIRGVSEQAAQDRRPGQHYEQINMISDPVRGLARRHGSINNAEFRFPTFSWATEENFAKITNDTAGHKCMPFQCNGKDYDLIYRTRNHPDQIADMLAFCYNKTDKKYIPVLYDNPSLLVTNLKTGGVSTVVNVGKYLFMAPNIGAGYTTGVDNLAATKQFMVAWVRAGAYSRKYTIRLVKASGAVTSVEYTTPAASYQPLLDTSDIPYSDPEYTKKVNDRVNAYNGEVTKWIGTAAAGIVPREIAEQLRLAIVALAISGLTVTRVDSTITFDTSGMGDPFVELTCEDGGDGTLFRAVGNEVSSIEQVSTIHMPGKVVKVRPRRNDGTDVFYLKAYAKSPTAGGSWVEVTWREAAGYTSTPEALYAMATVSIVAGTETLCIGGSNVGLAGLDGGSHPGYEPSGSGDLISNPVPSFIGKKITYMGLFQDRLLIAAGAVVFLSRSGDYQNFFRGSVLSIEDSDPIEMFALGAEDDVIKAGTTYDRNLMLFGKRKQYTLSGRAPMTPKNASTVVQSSHEDAVDSFPINSGNFVFYNKVRNGIASAHQVQIGQLADTPESYEISKALDRYIKGRPLEQIAITAPNMLFIRTETQRDRMYVYQFLDTAAGSERLYDSWSTWVTDVNVGIVVGLSEHDGDILVHYLRRGQSATDDVFHVYSACDRFEVSTAQSSLPYADSLRLLTAAETSTLSSEHPNAASASVVFDDTSQEYMLGSSYDKLADLLEQYPGQEGKMWVGWNSPAYVTPTNPYLRDQNGKAIVTGRLTLTTFRVSIADSGGMKATYLTKFGSFQAVDFTGRLVGSSVNQVGIAPIVTTDVSVPVGRESRDFTYTLHAKTWLPFTVTAIEWSGQFFNNARRV